MKRAIVSLAVLMALAACGGADGRAPSVSPEGDWRLVDGVEMIEGYPITLSIADGAVTGRAACNSFFGEATYDGATISIGGLGQTEMACEPAVMESESAFLTALAEMSGFEIRDGALVLTDGVGQLAFEPVVGPPTSDLVDTRWVLESLISGDSVTSTMGEPAELVFADDGTFTGSTGCRTLEGSWVEAGGSIRITEMAAHGDCPDDLAAQDSAVVSVLEDFTVEIEGDTLTLSSMGNQGLSYKAGS